MPARRPPTGQPMLSTRPLANALSVAARICRGRAARLAATAPAAALTACSMPGPSATDDAVSRLERFTYTATATDGTEIRVRAFRSGSRSGRRVIYIHGTPGDALAWADDLAEPVPGTEAVAIDRPGFGKSSPRRAFPSLQDQAAAIEPLLDSTDAPAILVGHSLGAPIAAAVAAAYPDRVGGLVLVAGSLDPDLERVLTVQRVGEWPPVAVVLPRWIKHANRELLPLEAELRALEPRLAEIAVPIEIVHGTEDQLVPYANVEFMRTRFTAAEVRITTLEGANHFLPWNNAAAVRAAIQRLAIAP